MSPEPLDGEVCRREGREECMTPACPCYWEPLSTRVQFSAKRGDEDLFVQVIGGMEHPSGNPQLMCVVLEVRLGPDV